MSTSNIWKTALSERCCVLPLARPLLLRAVSNAVTQLEQGSTSHTKTRRRNIWMDLRPILCFPRLRLEYMAVPCSVPIPPPNRGSRGEAPTCVLKVRIKYTYQLTSAVATRTTLPLKLSPKDISCIYLLHPFLGSIWMLFNLFSSFNLAKKILWPHDMELDRTLHCHRGPLCC